MKKKQYIKNKEIYDLLQAYRHEPIDNQDKVVKRFDAIIRHFNNEIKSELKEQLQKTIEYLSHDMNFKDEKQRKEAVKMYIDDLID